MEEDFRVISANRAFYKTFRTLKEETVGRSVYELGGHQGDIPALRKLLGEILPHNEKFEDFPVEHDFAGIGHKCMLLNGRKILRDAMNAKPMILLAIEDVTEKRMAG